MTKTINISLFKMFVTDQDEARRFYVEQLGFEVAEDKRLGDYRWLLVRTPGSAFSINLEVAHTGEQQALVGRQGGGLPLFSISTDDCLRDYRELTARGVTFESEPKVMPFGTGVMMQDLYGNKIYLNQDPH
jgi:catechol 2,3-dioxygenase-like lactoylglutathione lyase family enzyme